MAAHGGGTTNGCEALVLQSGTRAFLRGRAWRVARGACQRKRMTQWPTITTAIPGSAPELWSVGLPTRVPPNAQARGRPRHTRTSGAATTMERIRTIEAAAHEGRRVRVQGWLHALRR